MLLMRRRILCTLHIAVVFYSALWGGGGNERYEINTLHTAFPPPPIHFEGHWKGWALERDLSSAHSCSKTHIHKITNVPVFYMVHGLHDLIGANQLHWPLEGMGLGNLDFIGPK